MKKCSIENCKNKHYGLGYCQKHHRRFKKYGDVFYVEKVVGEDRSNHPLYTTYSGIKRRCLNPKSDHFEKYGGRGITICEYWLGTKGFTNFCNDMGEKPTPSHTVDRKDNDKGYSKENCRWATKSEQVLNTRRNVKNPYVYFYNHTQKWSVQKRLDGKLKFFGYYSTQEEAVDTTIKLGFILK